MMINEIPPCEIYEEGSVFWSYTQAELAMMKQAGLLNVVTIKGEKLSYLLVFFHDGRVEIVILPL